MTIDHFLSAISICFNFLLLNISINLYVHMVSLYVCICTTFIPGDHRGHKTVLHTCDLGLQKVEGHHVGSRNFI